VTTPLAYGGLGIATHGLGQLGLGGPQPAQNFALATMAKTAQPFIAHLYDHNLRFKRLLGNAALLNKPGLKQTQNGGFQPVTLELASALPSGVNLTQNPSFEPTSSGQWGPYNNSSGLEPMTFADFAGSPFDGANCVRCTWSVNNTTTKGIYGGGPSGGIWQSNTTYTISWWSRASGTNIGQVMALAWNVGPRLTTAIQNPPLTANWQRYIFTITWGPGPIESAGPLYIYCGAPTQGALDFDLIQVVQGTTAAQEGIVLGDVIRLAEQDGAILFSGNVETTPDEVGVGTTHHQIVVTPWIAELGDAFFNKTYATSTDVAQFVRDAIAGTAHCSVSPISCPDTGVKAIYDFQNTNALDAVHVAKQIAGANFWYFVDAQGVVLVPTRLYSEPGDNHAS